MPVLASALCRTRPAGPDGDGTIVGGDPTMVATEIVPAGRLRLRRKHRRQCRRQSAGPQRAGHRRYDGLAADWRHVCRLPGAGRPSASRVRNAWSLMIQSTDLDSRRCMPDGRERPALRRSAQPYAHVRSRRRSGAGFRAGVVSGVRQVHRDSSRAACDGDVRENSSLGQSELQPA